MAENEKIELYENQAIRTAWNETEEEWYFSIVDVVRVLTDSHNPTAYWRKLKQRLKDEGYETVTNCHGLKMTAPDGKKTAYRRRHNGTAVSHHSVHPVQKS